MDDIADKIQSVLSDPESMKQISEIAQMLGLSPEAEPPAESGAPMAALAPQPNADSGMPDIGALMSLAGMLKNAGGSDDNINFLIALRPLLNDDKKQRIDRAVKILKLINLLPVLKESGILGGDFLGIL